MTVIIQCSTRDKDLVDISQFKTAQIEAIKPPQKKTQAEFCDGTDAVHCALCIVHGW